MNNPLKVLCAWCMKSPHFWVFGDPTHPDRASVLWDGGGHGTGCDCLEPCGAPWCPSTTGGPAMSGRAHP